MKELEKVTIEDVEYAYDSEKEYIKDGHAYCKVCHERKDEVFQNVGVCVHRLGFL